MELILAERVLLGQFTQSAYVAFAPDGLHPVGGYPGNDDEGRAMQREMDKAKLEQDFIAAAKFLKGHERSDGKLGAVGFCFGGYVVNMLAAVIPDELDAGVPFYGTPAAKERAFISDVLVVMSGNDSCGPVNGIPRPRGGQSSTRHRGVLSFPSRPGLCP